MANNKETLVQKIKGGQYAKAFQWGRLATITGSAQILIQAIGFVSGIVVIRLLPTEEYALYTLANTMLGTMTVLADSGVANGVMAEGGKVWQDPKKLGAVISTGMDLRKKFAIGSLLVAAPILIYLLRHHDASWLMSVLIFLCLIPAFLTSLSGTLLTIPSKLKQDITPLQKNLVAANLGRFFMILLLFVFPWTFVAILAAGIPKAYTNYRLRKISAPYADWQQKPDKAVRKRILRIVKRLMPGAVYYCVSGQISVWLISVFGSSTSVAQVGALSRLAMLLTVVSYMFSILIYPRFARLPAVSKILLPRFLQIIAALVGISIVVVAAVWLFSSPILWVLGDEYAGLDYELVLTIIGSCLGLISAGCFTMATSKGWAINPVISISTSVVAIVAGAVLIKVSTLEGVLLFNIFIFSIQMLLNGSYCLIKILQNNKTIDISSANEMEK